MDVPIYSADNTEGRRNRISFYHYGYYGGEGPGSHGCDTVARGEWVHVVAVVSKPEHRIWFYRNSDMVDTDSFAPGTTHPIPDSDLRSGNAPIRMGSQDGTSHFAGAIDNVYFYNRKLTGTEVLDLYQDATP